MLVGAGKWELIVEDVSLRIELHLPSTATTESECRLRAVIFNDSYAPVVVSRNSFVGPNVRDAADGSARPESVEPTFGGRDEPLMLQPFTFYGRERAFNNLSVGEATVEAYYRDPDSGEETSASDTITVR
jgi:hypothetical protein